MVTADQCICAATSAEANELAERHMASFVDSNLEHYELMSTHFATAKGYDAYAKKSEIARTAGRDGLVNALAAGRGTRHAGSGVARLRGAAGVCWATTS